MGQGEGCASGVSIDPQLVGIDPATGAVVLTNYHVIADMGNRPPLQLGGKGEVFRAEIIRQSYEFDLALLFVPGVEFPTAALAEASPPQGTAVRAVGFPNNQPLTVKNSLLLGKTQDCLAIAPCLAIQQGTITFGNSGGPLESNHQVIGITQGEIADEIAIPVEQIRQFLAGEQPDFTSPPFEPGFPPMQEPPPYFPYPVEAPYPYW
jgi:S1-C subfamily serine protease